MRVAIIINPVSGTGGRPEVARRRAELAAALVDRRRLQADISLTERAGHARELAEAAIDRGVSLVVAWGGDGTVNEVANALAFREAVALGIVASGSGNGLARELQLPRDPATALEVALAGQSRAIDCGEMDGRLFVNVAGLGLDARVAHQFAAHGLVRRGFARYLEIGVREMVRFKADPLSIRVDHHQIEARPLILAIANGRQYGNGALIAPDARVDDGKLDVVVVAERALWRTAARVPDLFRGRLKQVPGVTMLRGEEIEIASTRQLLYHVDGEPYVGGPVIRVRVRPGALRVRVPFS